MFSKDSPCSVKTRVIETSTATDFCLG